MLFLTNIFLYKYNTTYRVRGLKLIYKLPRVNLFTYSDKKRPYRNLTSVGIINYINCFDHAALEKTSAFTHYFATYKYIQSNIKTFLLK